MTKGMERALGKVEGRLEGVEKTLKCIDNRLGAFDKQAAKSGGIAGGLMGITMALGTEFIKKKLGM